MENFRVCFFFTCLTPFASELFAPLLSLPFLTFFELLLRKEKALVVVFGFLACLRWLDFSAAEDLVALLTPDTQVEACSSMNFKG